MNTNKIVLKTADEFMKGYTGVYAPLMPLFLGKSQAWSREVGKLNFKRLEARGDLRQKHVTPKDTVLEQIASAERSRTFKKYFLANQYRESNLQDHEGVEDVVGQVLDEHWRHQDELFLYGEGTSASNMINNGLFWSNDPFYKVETSSEMANTGGHLPALHTKIVEIAEDANKLAGSKLLVVYGDTTIAKMNSIYAEAATPFRRVLQEVLQGYEIAKIPKDVGPASNGFLIVNRDQIMMHYTALPALVDQGVNAELMYTWHNFLMGSCMLEVLVKDAIIKQPLTYA